LTPYPKPRKRLRKFQKERRFVCSVIPHNPLIEKVNAATEKVNRRRQRAAETSAKVADDLNMYFDRLALLAAGALTFSVTLLGQPTHPHSHRFFIIYAAWGCLLISLGSSLLRVFSNIGHRFYRVGAGRAEAEVEYIDADTEAVDKMDHALKYADATEPFDKKRELKINENNRAVWKTEQKRTEKIAARLWRLAVAAQWTTGVSLFLGFLLLMSFAVYNTYSR
jgi:hypothetical protein